MTDNLCGGNVILSLRCDFNIYLLYMRWGNLNNIFKHLYFQLICLLIFCNNLINVCRQSFLFCTSFAKTFDYFE